MEDKDDDNEFECLKVNSKFKICWHAKSTCDAM